ncbi:MAG: pyruvate kinase alpha/beta domain-containing protein, partial [Pirellulales bacterium]
MTGDDFNVLGANWEAWAQETAGIVEQLYEAENPDLASQQATLAKLHVKLGTIEKSLNDNNYKVIHPQLAALQSRLSRRVDLCDALLATMDADPEGGRAQRVGRGYSGLTAAINTLRSDLNKVRDGSAWLPYVRADQLLAAAAANDTSDDAIATLTKVQQKIDGRGSLSDAAQQEFLGRDSFTGLSAAIGDVVAASSWRPAADQVARIREPAARIVAAVESYEQDGSDAAAAEINAAYQELKNAAADGGARISAVMRQHYFAHNMRLIASEGFLKKSVGESRTEQGRINEPISEAWVSGFSCTTTNVTLDLQPNNEVAQFNLRISGRVNANTTANAAQAVVYGGSTGNFSATKPIMFTGTSFQTSPASVAASASTYANDVDAKAILVFSFSGASIQLVSKYRPRQPLIGFTSELSTLRRLPLMWGTEGHTVEE